MPHYRTLFVDRSGRRQVATLCAADRPSLSAHVETSMNAFIIEARRSAAGPFGARRARISKPMLLTALDSLELMLVSGVRINQALRVLAECAPAGGARTLWTELVSAVEETGRFGESLRRFPGVFNGALAGVIEAHESAGRLPEGVRHARDYVAQMREIRRDSLRGMAYPALVLVTGLGSAAVLCAFTLPRFSAMLRDIGVVRTNPLTAFFFGASALVVGHPVGTLACLAAPAVAAGVCLHPRLRSGRDRLILRVPLVRGAVEALSMARICATYGALSESGVRVVEALEACSAAAGNEVYAGGVRSVAAAVRDNASVGEGFERARVFAPEVVLAVKSGEASLPGVFGRLSTYYSREARHRVALAIGMIEPVMLALVLVWVLGIALAVILPVVEVLNGIR
jgi:type II secretory pathway component PulF